MIQLIQLAQIIWSVSGLSLKTQDSVAQVHTYIYNGKWAPAPGPLDLEQFLSKHAPTCFQPQTCQDECLCGYHAQQPAQHVQAGSTHMSAHSSLLLVPVHHIPVGQVATKDVQGAANSDINPPPACLMHLLQVQLQLDSQLAITPGHQCRRMSVMHAQHFR